MMLTKHESKHLLYKHNNRTAEQPSGDFSRIRVQIDWRELAFEFLLFAVFRWRVYRRSSKLFTFCFLHFFFNGLNINFVFCGCYKEENNKYYIMSSHAYSFELFTQYKVILPGMLLTNITSLHIHITRPRSHSVYAVNIICSG